MKSDLFQRQSTPTPTLVSNFAINFSGHIVLFAAAILTTPYILTTLGAHRYGTLVVLLAYAEVFGLLELGLNATLVKYLAESLAQDRHTDLDNYFGTSLSLFLGGGVLISILVLPLYIPVLIFGAGAVEASIMGSSPQSHLYLLGAVGLLSLTFAPWAAAAGLRISLE